MKNFIYLTVLLTGCFTTKAQQWTSSRPDGHAPIGVMGDHTHHQGEWMVSYRYMDMRMHGVRIGEQKVTKEDVLQNYQMSPEKMSMGMHMLGFMYAPSDRVTLMVMANYSTTLMNEVWMQHKKDSDPKRFEYDNNGQTVGSNGEKMGDSKNSGFSDMRVAALINVLNHNRQSLHINANILIPTGSVTARGTSMSTTARSPYPMQLGKGSWGTQIGLTYLFQGSRFSGGFQPMVTHYLNKNSEHYRYGNSAHVNLWGAIKIMKWLSLSGRIEYSIMQKIVGKDNVLNNQKTKVPNQDGRKMMPTLEENFSGGETSYAGIGLNFYVPSGKFKNIRLGAEYLLPIYQNLNGVQMNRGNTFVVGIQYAWGGH